jgi:hypothetical protein
MVIWREENCGSSTYIYSGVLNHIGKPGCSIASGTQKAWRIGLVAGVLAGERLKRGSSGDYARYQWAASGFGHVPPHS